MQAVEWKLKVALLWMLQPVNYVSYILISLFDTQPSARQSNQAAA